MGFFKLLTGVITGIAAFGGALLHQAAPRSDRAPAPRIEPSVIEAAPEHASSEPSLDLQPAILSADATTSPSENPPTGDEFAIGTITGLASSTITILQGDAERVIALTPDTRINARMVAGEAIIVVGSVDADGTMTALSIEERNSAQKEEPLPEILSQ